MSKSKDCDLDHNIQLRHFIKYSPDAADKEVSQSRSATDFFLSRLRQVLKLAQCRSQSAANSFFK